MAETPLRRHRAKQLLTQEALAEAAEVNVSTIIRAERGASLNVLTQERIAQALGVDRDVLFPAPAEQPA